MPTFGDLFCGAGGAARGLIEAGFTPAWAIDFREDECRAYRSMLRRYGLSARDMCADIREVDPATLSPVDLLWASPPCQPWSEGRRAQGKPWGFEIPQGKLVQEVHRIVEALEPRAVIMENVGGIPDGAIPPFTSPLVEMGYRVVHYRLEARFWLPQKRDHLFVVALRNAAPPLPEVPILTRHTFAEVKDGRGASPLTPAQLRYMLAKRTWSTPVVTPGDLLPTVTTRPYDARWTCIVYEGNGRYRFPTFKEALRAQGFGDDRILLRLFRKKPGAAWRMLGNALPPALARAVLKAQLAGAKAPD